MNKRIIAKTAKIKNSKIKASYIKIEHGVMLDGVEIQAKKIIIKKNANLNKCKIFSKGSLEIGENSTIKENSIINSFLGIKIGDRTLIDRNVTIGGMQSEQSEFVIGDDSVILYSSYLNNTRKITIGNRVGIGGYCLIFTHSSWPNVLDGNPYKFAPVKIEDDVWLPWNVTVFPNITIGKNVTIGGCSLVNKNIPPNTFAAGIPIKVISKKTKISFSKKNKIVFEILKDFNNYLNNYLKRKTSIKIEKNSCSIKVDNLRLNYTNDFTKITQKDIIISFKIPSKVKNKHEWIELNTLSAQTSNEISKKLLFFLKRYGIKIPG